MNSIGLELIKHKIIKMKFNLLRKSSENLIRRDQDKRSNWDQTELND